MSLFPHPNDPHGFTPQCPGCDDAGCDRCCPTSPVTLEDLNDMPFPTDHPHIHANRLEAQEPDDKGACYLERIDADRIIVKVRSPREKNESSVSIPWNIWLKMIAGHQSAAVVNGELLAALKDLLRVSEAIGVFKNGVTHNGIDEGETIVAGYMDAARAAIRKAEAAALTSDNVPNRALPEQQKD